MVNVVCIGFALIVVLAVGGIGKRRGWSTGQMIALGLAIAVPVDMLIGYNWLAISTWARFG